MKMVPLAVTETVSPELIESPVSVHGAVPGTETVTPESAMAGRAPMIIPASSMSMARVANIGRDFMMSSIDDSPCSGWRCDSAGERQETLRSGQQPPREGRRNA
jgi:hypothetical protein